MCFAVSCTKLRITQITDDVWLMVGRREAFIYIFKYDI